MGRFLFLVDAPAVIAFADRDVLTAGSVESPRRIGRIVFVGQFFDEGPKLLRVKGDLAVSIGSEPGDDAAAVEGLALIAELISDGHASVILLGFFQRRQRNGCSFLRHQELFGLAA